MYILTCIKWVFLLEKNLYLFNYELYTYNNNNNITKIQLWYVIVMYQVVYNMLHLWVGNNYDTITFW